MSINVELIYKKTLEHYEKANQKLLEKRTFFEHAETAISDVIPGFDADKLEFCSYDKENFAVLFVDMRNSTKRAQDVGAEKTFLTMHVFLTALLEIVKCYNGKVIDIMGDGIMVFWGGREARAEENMIKTEAVRNAGKCGRSMLKIRNEVINKIIKEKGLGNEISFGVGVTFDSVVVTKIGIPNSYDVKAFGDCINVASKYSKLYNQMKVSKKVKEIWPSSKNGTLRFVADKDGGYIVEETTKR